MLQKTGLLSSMILLLLVFISFTKVVFDMSGKLFYLSLLLHVILLGYSFGCVVLLYNRAQWGWTLLLPATLVMMLYAFLVYLRYGFSDWLGYMLISLVGIFTVTVVHMRESNSSGLHKLEVYDAAPEVKKARKAPAKRKKKKSVRKKKRK